MRLARLAGLGVALAIGAASGGAQEPGTRTSAPPDLTLWSPASMNPLMNSGGVESFFISVDRDAYVAAFEVGRDGRMRVLYPRSPKDAGRVKGGKTVSVAPWSYDMLGFTVSPTEVPYVIALASDDPIDLSQFGRGKAWQYRVRLDGVREPDVTMEAVGRLVASDTTQRFAGDYGYVAPRISASTQLALARCTSLTSFSQGRDAHDYWLYRDLWMSFGPRDGFWFSAVSPWLGWGWNGMAPMLFPSVAAWPTPGGGCSPTVRLPMYAYTPPQIAPPVRADTTRPDSTRSDTARAGNGRTIAVEQPRGVDAAEGLSPAARSRFSSAEIARIRNGFHTEADGNAAHGEMIAGRHNAAPQDRRGGSSWTAEPMDARPTSRGGGSRYAEPEERAEPRWPARGAQNRNDPERGYNGNYGRTGASGAGSAGSGAASSGSSGWQRPTSVGGADVTRASSPVSAPSSGAGRSESTGGARSPISGSSGSSGSSSSPSSSTPPKGQQQNQ